MHIDLACNHKSVRRSPWWGSMLRIKALVAVMLLVISVSCDNDKVESALRQLQSRPISLPLSEMQRAGSKTDADSNIISSHLTYVIFLDTAQCASCNAKKMYLWNDIMREVNAENNKVSFCVIMQPTVKDRKTLKVILDRDKETRIPLFIDTAGIFIKNNPHVPRDNVYHQFLINSEGEVLLVGDIRTNRKVRILLDKVMAEKE